VKEDRPIPCASKDGEDMRQGRIIEGAGSHRHVDVLHAQLAHQGRFVHGAGLHRVPEIKDDIAPGGLESLELFARRLAAADDVGKYLAGVCDAADCLKCGGH
jgi:hypothetical protein